MADKRITDLSLISAFTGSVNLPVDDTVQTYRATGAQLLAYIRQNRLLVSAKSANYTILDDDLIETVLMTTGGTNRTITLPTAADNAGRRIIVYKVDSGTGRCIVDGEGSETINGKTTITLYAQWDRIELVCDGSNWFRISGEWNWTAITESNVSNITTSIAAQGGFFKRVENDMLVRAAFESGGANAEGSVVPIIPESLTFDATKVFDSFTNNGSEDNIPIGTWRADDSGSATDHAGPVCFDLSTGSINLRRSDGTGSNVSTVGNPFTVADNDTFSWDFRIPISEWA